MGLKMDEITDGQTVETEHGIIKKFHSPFIALATGLIVVALLGGLLASGHLLHTQNTKSTLKSTNKHALNTAASSVPEAQATSTPTPATAPSPNPTPSTTKPKAPVVSSAPTPTPTPTPSPAPNTTNCLPPNPNSYQTYFANDTNSQYLQTNSYANTTKLYAALQFAGLIDTINTKQYVVLAMDDSQWNNFTQAQLNWMNASPANMKSVLGWQIITSCITWDGVNPVKDIPAGNTQTVNTLNGSVIFTSKANGEGTFGNGSVGIWDWFTSNGSVTIAGFVNTSSIP